MAFNMPWVADPPWTLSRSPGTLGPHLTVTVHDILMLFLLRSVKTCLKAIIKTIRTCGMQSVNVYSLKPMFLNFIHVAQAMPRLTLNLKQYQIFGAGMVNLNLNHFQFIKKCCSNKVITIFSPFMYMQSIAWL